MKAIAIDTFGGVDTLHEIELEIPQVESDQVLIAVKAVSVNPVDTKIRAGLMPGFPNKHFPKILGRDVAGHVIAVGSAVSKFKIGDRVVGDPAPKDQGTYSEFTVVPQNRLVKLPDSIGYETAATLPTSAATAYQGLFIQGNLKQGQRVLIHGGMGGVGSIAIQLAHQAGAFVITTASTKNHDRLLELGADVVIDYHTTQFETVVSNIDLVFDTIGNDTQIKSIEVLNETGSIVTIVGKAVESDKVRFFSNKSSVEVLEALVARLDDGSLHPIIGEIIPMSVAAIRDAHEKIERNQTNGKIVLINDTSNIL